jgi:hypothetical protein
VSGTIATRANIAARTVVAINSGSCGLGDVTVFASAKLGRSLEHGQAGNVSCCRLRARPAKCLQPF